MPDSICVIETDRVPIVIRANPTKPEVRAFLEEYGRRHAASERGGYNSDLGGRVRPDTRPDLAKIEEDPTFQVISATFYLSEQAWHDGDKGVIFDLEESPTTPPKK